jgi:hypothetical protein
VAIQASDCVDYLDGRIPGGVLQCQVTTRTARWKAQSVETDDLRQRLIAAGEVLAPYVDELLALAAPSVRLRPGTTTPTTAAAPEKWATPSVVPGLESGVVGVAGSFHCLVLLGDGTVMAWGDNAHGQVGDGTRANRPRPVPVPGCREVVSIAVGAGHSVALTSESVVLAWGRNDQWQLGDGTTSDRPQPEAIDVPTSGVARVTAGDDSTLVVYEDGSVLGCKLLGFERPGEDDFRRPGRLAVRGLEDAVRDVAAGAIHKAATLDDGRVVYWSVNHTEARPLPGIGLSPRSVAAGWGHGLAADAAGSMYSWQISGTPDPRASPLPVPDDRQVLSVAAGMFNSFCLLDDGTVCSWGQNFRGALGDGTEISRSEPRRIAGLEAISAIAPGMALTTEGAVLVWGGRVRSVRRHRDSEGPVGATRLGGRPDLPVGAPWPLGPFNRPIPFVAQVDLSEVAPFGAAGVLPNSGLLSFFFDPSGSGPDQVAPVVYTPAGARLRRVEPPEELTDGERFRPVPLVPHHEATLPPAWNGPVTGHLQLPDTAWFAYEFDQEVDDEGPWHRLLGHPDAVQGDPRPDSDVVLLLQVSEDDRAGMEWGDSGSVYFMIRNSDLAALRFDRAWAELQCH